MNLKFDNKYEQRKKNGDEIVIIKAKNIDFKLTKGDRWPHEKIRDRSYSRNEISIKIIDDYFETTTKKDVFEFKCSIELPENIKEFDQITLCQFHSKKPLSSLRFKPGEKDNPKELTLNLMNGNEDRTDSEVCLQLNENKIEYEVIVKKKDETENYIEIIHDISSVKVYAKYYYENLEQGRKEDDDKIFRFKFGPYAREIECENKNQNSNHTHEFKYTIKEAKLKKTKIDFDKLP